MCEGGEGGECVCEGGEWCVMCVRDHTACVIAPSQCIETLLNCGRRKLP